MASAAAVDPAETIVTAVRELYDQLRELVDRGPTDDPRLLDELGKLTRRIRSKITRARKLAEPVAPTAAPAERTAPAPAPMAAAPGAERAPAAVIPAAVSATGPASDRAAVRRAESEPAPTAARSPSAEPRPAVRGRHRRPQTVPWWMHALVILLIVAGTAVSVATAAPWWGCGGAVAGLLVVFAHRRALAEPMPGRR